jgi:hypothetical protein
MLGRVERAVLSVGEIGRVHIGRWGEGWRAPALVVHRAARGPSAAGEQHGRDLGRGLPPTPQDVWRENVARVAEAMQRG